MNTKERIEFTLLTAIGGAIAIWLAAFPFRAVTLAVWHALVKAASAALSWLGATHALTLPAWAWLLVGAGVVVLSPGWTPVRHLLFPHTADEHYTPVSATPMTDNLNDATNGEMGDTPLTAEQRRVMTLMGENHGRVYAEYLMHAVGIGPLRTQKVVEELETVGLLDSRRDIVRGLEIFVTRAGRDYLIDNGLA